MRHFSFMKSNRTYIYEAMTQQDFSLLIDCEINDTKTINFRNPIECNDSFFSNEKLGFETNDIKTNNDIH